MQAIDQKLEVIDHKPQVINKKKKTQLIEQINARRKSSNKTAASHPP